MKVAVQELPRSLFVRESRDGPLQPSWKLESETAHSLWEHRRLKRRFRNRIRRRNSVNLRLQTSQLAEQSLLSRCRPMRRNPRRTAVNLSAEKKRGT